VHNSLGVALVNRGDLEGAVGELRRAVEIRPQFAEAHENLAWVLMDRGDLTGAWGEVHLAQKYGGELNQKRLQRLTEGMPEPKE